MRSLMGVLEQLWSNRGLANSPTGLLLVSCFFLARLGYVGLALLAVWLTIGAISATVMRTVCPSVRAFALARWLINSLNSMEPSAHRAAYCLLVLCIPFGVLILPYDLSLYWLQQ